jgi:hypothetical protein
MRNRNSFVSVLLVCLLATGLLGTAPVNAASVWQAFLEPGESAKNNVIEIKHRRSGKRGKRLYLPIVPYSAYDYPYYYRRGHFPTHIGPGYIYYGYPYHRMRSSDRCSHRHRRCVARQRGACICR